MKKIIVFALVFLGLTSLTALVGLQIYTERQKDLLIDNLIAYYQPFEAISYENEKTTYSSEIQPLHLFNLLYANIYTQKPENYQDGWSAGYSTSKIYQEQWRNVVMKNPQLVFDAWNLLGDDFVMGLNSKLGYYGANKSDFSYKFEVMPFKTKEFWVVQKNHIVRYQNLISHLLELDDKRLNFFISNSEMYDDAKSYDFNLWLKENNLLSYTSIQSPYLQIPSANNGNCYPGDLILLANRVRINAPEWTPRRFLTEVRKFSDAILLSIDKNIR